jgi:hypothetical protein
VLPWLSGLGGKRSNLNVVPRQGNRENSLSLDPNLTPHLNRETGKATAGNRRPLYVKLETVLTSGPASGQEDRAFFSGKLVQVWPWQIFFYAIATTLGVTMNAMLLVHLMKNKIDNAIQARRCRCRSTPG